MHPDASHDTGPDVTDGLSDALFRALATGANDEIYLLRPSGAIVWANDAAAASLGWSRQELCTMQVSDFSPGFRRLTQDGGEAELQSDGSAVFITEHLTRDGRRIPKEIHASRLHSDGEPIQMAIARDISDRRDAEDALRRSEQHYRGLFENAHDAVLLLDAERYVVIDANPAACELYGYARREFVGLQVSAFAMPDTDIAARFRSVLAQPQQHRFETRQRRRDGSTMELEIHATVIEHRGRPAILSQHRDLTARRDLEARLHHGQKMEAVGRLAGGIAHDFNNLLTVISGHGDLLLEMLTPETDAYEHARRVLSATQRGAAVARQLLTFSRRGVTSRAVVDLNRILNDISPMLRTLIGEDVRLDVRPAPEPLRVNADADQLEQVIVNLAVNARDAMPKGGALSLVAGGRAISQAESEALGLTAPGAYVELRVSDTGSGMPPEVAAKIFEPFFTTKPPGAGTGLGLATAYGIVAQHGGVLAVESRSGRGTTFTIVLPRTMTPGHVAASETPSRDTERGSETLLLVEDDADVRQLTRTVLQRQGYRVLEAEHGQAALTMSAQTPGVIHAMVSDVIMPGMTGPETADAIAATRPGLRVLFISGYTQDTTVEHSLPKPFLPGALLRELRKLLRPDE